MRRKNVVFVSFVVLICSICAYAQAADAVLINEIMFHPYHAVNTPENTSAEYLELFNPTEQAVNLSGWRLTGGIDYVFPDSSVIPARGYLVVAADPQTFSLLYPDGEGVTGAWNRRLGNASETLELVNESGERIDRVHYTDEGDWAIREFGSWDFEHRGWVWSDATDGGGHSLELINAGLSNKHGQNWQASLLAGGTPGRVNSRAAANIAPIILELSHHPLIPSDQEQVRVQASILDESDHGLVVTLYYRLDRSVYSEPGLRKGFDAASFTEVRMQRAQGADKIYWGLVPAQVDGEVVEFYVQAADAQGLVRTYPSPSFVDGRMEQITNALYCVDSALSTGAAWIPGSQPLYYLVMTQAEWAELDQIGDSRYGGPLFASEAMSNAQMNATFISVDGVEEQVRYGVGGRNRGNRSRANPPMSYRINIPHDRPWKGKTAINLNSKYPHLQLMGSVLFQLADLAAASAEAIQLRINGMNPALENSRTYGTYVAVEALDRDWAGHHLPGDSNGNLYRCTYYDNGRTARTFADLDYKEGPGQVPDPDDYRLNYPKKTNAQAEDWSDLLTLIDRLNNPTFSDDQFLAEIEQVLDLDQWTRYMATDSLMGNREGGLTTGTGDDYAMYRGLEDPRFWLLPHDLDTLLGQGDKSYDPQYPIMNYANVDGLRRLLSHPDVIQRYYQQFDDLVDSIFAPERFPYITEQFLGAWVPNSVIEGARGIDAFVEERTTGILGTGESSALIPTAFSWDAPVLRDGMAYTQTGDIALSGTFNASSTRSLSINGQVVAESDWSQEHGRWSLDYGDLLPGINRLTVQAFAEARGTGQEVGRHAIDVWYDTGTMQHVTGTIGALAGPSQGSVHLQTRDSYLPGVPVLVRVELHDPAGRIDRHQWDAQAMLSVDSPDVSLSVTRIPLCNGLGSALVRLQGNGTVSLTAQVNGLEVTQVLTDSSDAPRQTVSGDIAGDTEWEGVVHVTGDVRVGPQQTLTIQPGTLVLLDGVSSGDGGTDIDVEGRLQVLGTQDSPVSFTAADPGRPWGEVHQHAGSEGLYKYAHVTRAGRAPGGGHTGSGPAFRISDASVTFEHCCLTDHVGKVMQVHQSELSFTHCHLARSIMGPEMDDTALMFSHNWITEMFGTDDNDAIYIHSQQAGQDVSLRGCVIAHTDDDGLDTLHAQVRAEDCIIRDCADKAVTVFGGAVQLDHVLLVDSEVGISTKDTGQGNPQVKVNFATIAGCQIGIEARDKTGEPDVVIDYRITNSIILGSNSVRTDYDPQAIHIDYSTVGETWPGIDNVVQDPLFVDALAHDYRLQTESPSRGAGQENGKPVDQGMYPYQAEPVEAPVVSGSFVWTPETGPYLLSGDVTVPAGTELVIEPGTSVYFYQDARLLVRGRLLAQGTDTHMIRFTRAPQSNGTWRGIQFVDTDQDNRIAYAVLEYGRTYNGMIGLENSRLLVDHVTFDHTDLRRIRTQNSSLVVRNCVFEDIFAGNEAPSTDNLSEHIWGGGIPEHGQFLLENNVFGVVKGHNDSVDFDGPARPAPIIQIRGNLFRGSGDDALDLQGDAHIEGNVFLHSHKDQYNIDPGHSNAISAGGGKEYVVVRNVFYDVDHATLIKDSSFMVFVNNTVVAADLSALYFDLAGQTLGPGRGAYVDGCIFAQTPVPLGEIDRAAELTVSRCLLPASWHDLGVGNIEADPLFIDPGGDFHLLPGSAAQGSGPGGLDRGAMVPARAAITGEPDVVTWRDHVVLQVSGPGITHYQYAVNAPEGPWSVERTVDVPIELTQMKDGDYVVYVVGLDSAGVWQANDRATRSRAWTVDSAYSRLSINEVMAFNQSLSTEQGLYPDAVELVFDGEHALELAGMSLSDDPCVPDKFVFAHGTVIEPGEYLVLWGSQDPDPSQLHLGFSLDRDGAGLYLFDALTGLLDSVEFGAQLPDLSIGRVNRKWRLTWPSLGAANTAHPLGDYRHVRINEWLSHGQVRFADDYVELYNPGDHPVDMGGCLLTDHPMTASAGTALAPLSFVAGQGYMVLTADGRNRPGHLDFKLAPEGEMLALFDGQHQEIDRIIYTSQTTDVSQGRSLDGAESLAFFGLPTPGMPNPATGQIVLTTVIPIDQVWAYQQSGEALPEDWADPAYDTVHWPTGPALLYVEGSSLPAPKNTPLTLGSMSYYFRTHFTLVNDPVAGQQFELSAVIDDGAIVYVNGIEALRLRMPGGPVDAGTRSSDTVDNAVYEGPFVLSADLFQQGDNVIAVEVHQTNSSSSDIVFGLQLDTITEEAGQDFRREMNLLAGLRISELMYHAEAGKALDYIEFVNVSDTVLDLTGVRVTDGVDFVFPDLWLDPGQVVVIVADGEAFTGRYGNTARIDGQYAGSFSNGGETLVVQLPEPMEAAILRFSYKDDWYPSTDGGGAALGLRDLSLHARDYGLASVWQAQAPTPGSL